MTLVTNCTVSSKEDMIGVVKRYFSRWRIEEYFRCKKQSFGFENFRVRSLQSINALNFWLSVCMLFLASIKERANSNLMYRECIEVADPIKDEVHFFYYRLADGVKKHLQKHAQVCRRSSKHCGQIRRSSTLEAISLCELF